MNKIDNLAEKTITVTKKYGFKFSKALGQNFLVDSSVLYNIVEAAKVNKNDFVIEIGPGIGTLTKSLLERADKVCSIELDSKLIPVLKEELREYDNFEIINNDVLKMNLNEITNGKTEVKIVANLPYYITTPVIIKIIKEVTNYESITLMLQKEVVDRIKAEPSTKDYGSLSIFVQYYCKPQFVTNVPKTSFIPSPKVDSAVVKLIKREKPPAILKDENLFFSIVRHSFNMRRKTLNNALKSMKIEMELIKSAFDECQIDPKRRGETLSISEFAALSNCIYDNLNKKQHNINMM